MELGPVTGWAPSGASLARTALRRHTQDVSQGPRQRKLAAVSLPCDVPLAPDQGASIYFQKPFMCELPVAVAALFLSSVLSRGRGWRVFLPTPPCLSILGRVCREGRSELCGRQRVPRGGRAAAVTFLFLTEPTSVFHNPW